MASARDEASGRDTDDEAAGANQHHRRQLRLHDIAEHALVGYYLYYVTTFDVSDARDISVQSSFVQTRSRNTMTATLGDA